MQARKLLGKIRENLKDYPIEYLKRKATDDRYPDSITKRLAIYNSSIYDEIYKKDIDEDYEIKDSVIKNITDDVNYYFSIYDPGDIETRDFTRELSLYLVLIAKKPLHPYGYDPIKDNVFLENDEFKCKNRIIHIKDEKSLCRYCVCKNAGYSFGFM
jgi:uncharacterized protein (UPF0305 family)